MSDRPGSRLWRNYCLACETDRDLTEHHVFGCRNSPETVVLCRSCHDAVHRAFSGEEIKAGACVTIAEIRAATR